MPWSAMKERLLPSISKGLVTTATVRMPSSLATCATTGAAPGAGATAHAGGDEEHVAALDQLDDAVTILHRRLPAHVRVGAGAEALGDVAADLQRGLDLGVLECLRVGVDAHEFHAIDAGGDHVGDGIAAAPTHPDHLDDGALAVRVHQFKHGCRSLHKYKRLVESSSSAVSFKSSPGTSYACDPASTWRCRPGSARDAAGKALSRRVEQQPHARGKNRVAHHIGEPAHGLRDAEAHRHVEHLLGQLDRAFHLGAAAGEHDARGDHLLEAAAAQLLAHQAEELLVARLDDLGERLPRQAPRRALADARHLDALVGIGELRERAGVADLDVLGVLRRGAHRDRDVIGDLVAGDRDHRGVADRAVGKHREIGGAAADVDQAHAQLLLVLGEHREARGELLEHDVLDGRARSAGCTSRCSARRSRRR